MLINEGQLFHLNKSQLIKKKYRPELMLQPSLKE